MGPALIHIAEHGTDMGIEARVFDHLRLGILGQAERVMQLD